ncbi:MAG: DUF4445 domain-containing protein [Deltaproteobacteria bacterium]|nr:DUF4445 domain-containing protein [Deltaproteobacteria bacterium]
MSRVTFLPGPVTAEAGPGERLLDVARRAGVGLVADCGGRGKCGNCRVEVDLSDPPSAALSAPTADEVRLLPGGAPGGVGSRGYRLACLARVHGDVAVTVPPESQVSASPPRKPFTRHRIRIHPAVSRVTVGLDPASSGETLGDRLGRALAAARPRSRPVPLDVLAELSLQADAEGTPEATATLFQGRDVLQVRPGRRQGLFGVALDLGTTSLVCFLCDLVADKIVAVRSAANPQAAYGEDVISRVAAVQRDPAKLRELQELLVGAVNALVADAAAEAGVDAADLLDVVAVGNPIMQHLLLGMSPLSLGRAPYLPLCRQGGEVAAERLGLRVFPRAQVHLLPMLSGFIGADTLAALLTRPPAFFRGTNLLVDVGTNGELVLAHDGVLRATSCATGPVFEGAHIRSGMRAAPGAIEKVRVSAEGAVELDVIRGPGRGSRPAGLCGSGVISAVSALVGAGVLRPDGAFDTDAEHRGLRIDPVGGVAEFVLAPASESHTGRDVVLGQWDVRAVQLGKAALRAGIDILCREAGVERLDRIYLAGTFGNYLDPGDLLCIGMLPAVGVDRIEAVGNAAGDGARLALFSTAYRRRAAALARRIQVVELSLRADFQEIFVNSMELGPSPTA